MKAIIEPFRIKMTEPIQVISESERIRKLKEAKYNVFLLDAEDCTIDLLTDSGTGAMSAKQWAHLMLGDESYAGSRSWKFFKKTLEEITGMKHIFPTHQGRAAESLLALTRVKKGDIIPNNSHFDTTRANMEFAGANALDLLCEEGQNLESDYPFKGNMNLEALEQLLSTNEAARIPFIMITVTNNTGGGQPVSMENIKATHDLAKKYNIPLVIDACRFAENAYLIKENESGYQERSLREIALEMFSYADASTMSMKKDGLSNIGGFFVCNNDTWAEDFKNALILREGFPTYGGLAGRDLEVLAVGIQEALEYEYQKYRHATVTYLLDKLDEKGIPVIKPGGGHAVFIDAGRFMEHIPAKQFPGVSLVNALYERGGVRSVELGTLMFGKKTEEGSDECAVHELVRLAFPRRVYTQSHFDYLTEVILEVWEDRANYSGYKIVKEPPMLRHFSAWMEPL